MSDFALKNTKGLSSLCQLDGAILLQLIFLGSSDGVLDLVAHIAFEKISKGQNL